MEDLAMTVRCCFCDCDVDPGEELVVKRDGLYICQACVEDGYLDLIEPLIEDTAEIS
jgi:hypothetical protein